MILEEALDVKALRAEVSDDDFATIQKLYHQPISREEIFAFPARIIDSEPTRKKRVWTPEFLKANVDKFVGAPLSIDHDHDQALMGYGECYSAEFKDNAIHGKFYIPLTNDRNKKLANDIQTEWDGGHKTPVSLMAFARNVESKDGLLYVKPSDSDRIMEISLVSKAKTPGCKTCVIGETSEPDIAESIDEELKTFAEAAWNDLKGEYCRLQAFALGVGISRNIYREVADSVSPITLKEMVKDLQKVLAEKRKEEEPIAPEDPETELTARLRNKLQSIRQTKGC